MDIDVSKGFQIGSFHYRVATDKKTNLELNSRTRYGECNSVMETIKVSSDYSKERYHETFLHEVIEAINTQACNGKVKHGEITNLASGLAQVTQSLGVNFTHKLLNKREISR